MAVVVQPGFFIQVLTLEAQGVVGGAGVAVAVTGLGELAPGAVVADPGELAVAFCQLHRGAEVVGVDAVERRLGWLVFGVEHRPGAAAGVDGLEAVFELGGGHEAVGFVSCSGCSGRSDGAGTGGMKKCGWSRANLLPPLGSGASVRSN